MGTEGQGGRVREVEEGDHPCLLTKLLEDSLHRPALVESYGIGGLTSKEIYHALFEIDGLRHFMEKGFDYCFVSAGINDTYKKMSTTYYRQSMECIILFLLKNHIHPIIQEIPDYNIQIAFDQQESSRKMLRRLSMLVNGTSLDCKQPFRDALDDMLQEKQYANQVSVIRYQSWNNDYANDQSTMYIDDGMHLNDYGYAVLDSMIAQKIFITYPVAK